MKMNCCYIIDYLLNGNMNDGEREGERERGNSILCKPLKAQDIFSLVIDFLNKNKAYLEFPGSLVG